MVVSEKHRFVCIQIPHTGSTSMASWCIRFFGGKKIRTKHDWQVPKEYNDFFKFALIRNPYDRMFTWWWFTKERDGFKGSFTNFMELIINYSENGYEGKTKSIPVSGFFKPQHSYVDSANIDFVISIEQLWSGLRSLYFAKGKRRIIKRFPHKNRTETKPTTSPKDYFNQQELGMVVKYCEEDFRRFGYEI